jgi:hypothetical protein
MVTDMTKIFFMRSMANKNIFYEVNGKQKYFDGDDEHDKNILMEMMSMTKIF